MKTILLIIFLVAAGIAQTPDDYVKNKSFTVKFDLALAAINTPDPVKREFLLGAIEHPRKDLEAQAKQIFSRSEMRVFYDLGKTDITEFQKLWRSQFDKKDLYRASANKDRIWKENFAYAIASKQLSRPQQLYLFKLADSLPLTKEKAVELEAEAVALFPRDLGRGIFATIGNAACPNLQASKKPVLGNCVCTTASGNWSCKDTCQTGTSCSIDPGNCGFMWLWDCNGMCNTGDEGN